MTSCCWFIRIAIAAALSVTIAAPFASAAGPCDELDPCAARACRIDTEIARAKAKGNTKDVARLERARSEMGHAATRGSSRSGRWRWSKLSTGSTSVRRISRRRKRAAMPPRSKKAQRKLSARKTLTDLQNAPL
jgi:hypothetical protein